MGKIQKVNLEFCQYSSRYDAYKEGKDINIFNKELSTGALMDIGVYCVQALVSLFGKPDSITAYPVLLENGIDGAGSILAKYDSMVLELSYSKITDSSNYSQIQGEKGTMYIEKIQNPKNVFIVYTNGQKEEIDISESDNNMIYELQDFVEAIEQEKKLDDFKKISLFSADKL